MNIFKKTTTPTPQAEGRPSAIYPNQRTKVDKCDICKKGFSLLFKQHECKRCLRAICFDCGKEKAVIPAYDDKTIHRVCFQCKEEQSYMKEFKQKQHMTLGRDSLIAKKWLLSLMKSEFLDESQLEGEYQLIHRQQIDNPNDQIKAIIQQYLLHTYNDVKFEMNYSFFEIHHLMTIKEHDDFVKSKLSNVLTAFFVSNPIKLTKHLVLLIVFLLYFCCESTAYMILKVLHREIIPIRFQYHKLKDDREVMEAEVNFILQNPEIKIVEEVTLAKKFIEYFSTNLLCNLFLNKLNFTCCLFLFDRLMTKKEFFDLEITLVSLFQLNLSSVQTNKMEQMQDILIRNTHITDIKQFFLKKDQNRIVTPNTSSQSKENLKSLQSGSIQSKDSPEISLDQILSKSHHQEEFSDDIEKRRSNATDKEKDMSVSNDEQEILQSILEYLNDEQKEPKLRSDLKDQNRFLCMNIISKIQQLREATKTNQKAQEQLMIEKSYVRDSYVRDSQTYKDQSEKGSIISVVDDKDIIISNLQIELEQLKLEAELLKSQNFELNLTQQELYQPQQSVLSGLGPQYNDKTINETETFMDHIKNENLELAITLQGKQIYQQRFQLKELKERYIKVKQQLNLYERSKSEFEQPQKFDQLNHEQRSSSNQVVVDQKQKQKSNIPLDDDECILF